MSLASSNVDLCNMAISNLGSGKEIASFSERSQEASACRRFYDAALQGTLRDYDWNFARKAATLALVTDFTPVQYPNLWCYSYRVPSDCVAVRRLNSGARLDVLDTLIPYEMQNDGVGDLILTDMVNVAIVYTADMEIITQYPQDFVMAFSMLLASYIAPRLTNGDPMGLGTKCFQKYTYFLSQAQKNNEVESQPDIEQDCELIYARDC